MTPPAEEEENVLQKSSHLCCHSFAFEPAKYKRWPVQESSSHNSLNCLQKSSKTTHTSKNEIREFSLFFFYSKFFFSFKYSIFNFCLFLLDPRSCFLGRGPRRTSRG
jgi:hypothetical protein